VNRDELPPNNGHVGNQRRNNDRQQPEARATHEDCSLRATDNPPPFFG
jgi:hypothetical protein